jgi:hypothetical protein
VPTWIDVRAGSDLESLPRTSAASHGLLYLIGGDISFASVAVIFDPTKPTRIQEPAKGWSDHRIGFFPASSGG